MGAPPHLSVEERRIALAKAAQARKERSLFKEEIRSGKRNWREVFDDSRESIQKMRVKELLESLPGFGEIRAASIMERAQISRTRRVQGVGKSQKSSLLQLLADK